MPVRFLPPPSLPPSLQLDDDVAANVPLAWARLLLARLAASYCVHVEGAEAETGEFEDPSSFPENLRLVGRVVACECAGLGGVSWGGGGQRDGRGSLCPHLLPTSPLVPDHLPF